MKAKKRLGLCLTVLGTVLLLAALFLFVRNHQQDARAAANAGDVLAQLALVSPDWTPPSPSPVPVPAAAAENPKPTSSAAAADATPAPLPSPSPSPVPELPQVQLDGHCYVGYLYFPTLERTLPVMELEYLEDLLLSPCLQKGSPHENNAVIAAHNFPSQFGPLRRMEGGESLFFTDMNGIEIAYTVTEVTTIAPWNSEAVLNSGHDLVLYTCTPGGKARVMIACDRRE